jgi:pilus assembly protein Flp/PilA
MSMLKQLWNDEEAANAVEYGLIAAVIAVALIGVFTLFRQEIVGLFTRQAGEIGNQ